MPTPWDIFWINFLQVGVVLLGISVWLGVTAALVVKFLRWLDC